MGLYFHMKLDLNIFATSVFLHWTRRQSESACVVCTFQQAIRVPPSKPQGEAGVVAALQHGRR